MAQDDPNIDWEKWERKLRNFRRWRACREQKRARNDSEIISHERENAERVQCFYRWCGNLTGRMLDIGCGGGWPKRIFSEVSYVGIDPIIVDDREDFSLIKGLGEYLPFKSAVFNSVLIMAALDHLASLSMTFRECFRVLELGGALYIYTSIESEYSVKGSNAPSTTVPKGARFRNKLRKNGFTGLLKSVYYAVYYSKPLSHWRDNTHVREIVLSELVALWLSFPARLIIERRGPHHAFIKAVKIG